MTENKSPEKQKTWESRPAPPFNKHLGFKVEEWKKGSVVITADVKPEHRNVSGLAHGGFVATMLDAATAFAGVYSEDANRVRLALTLSLNINFLGQAKTNRLKAIGKVTAQGRKIYYSSAKVYDMEDNMVASAQGVFRYRAGSEKD